MFPNNNINFWNKFNFFLFHNTIHFLKFTLLILGYQQWIDFGTHVSVPRV